MSVVLSIVIGVGLSWILQVLTGNFLISFFSGILCGLIWFFMTDGKT